MIVVVGSFDNVCRGAKITAVVGDRCEDVNVECVFLGGNNKRLSVKGVIRSGKI